MVDAEVVPQNHLDGFVVQGLVGGINMGEIYHCNVLHKFLMVTTDFEVGEVRH